MSISNSMLSRFQGDAGRKRLVELLRSQALLCSDLGAIERVASSAALRELETGEILIQQDATDDDLFFILSGLFRVFVNGREVAARRIGQHLGEMAIVDPSLRRTSTVVAAAPSLVAQLSSDIFREVADRNPRIWQAVAAELCRRLDERKKFHATPNAKTILFIGSSKEQLPLAEAIARGIPRDLAHVTLWSDGVFGASRFAIDDLDAQLQISDLALLVGAADDQVTSRGNEHDAPRDNVILELGLFIGALTRRRTFMLLPRGHNVKIPTDLLGLTPIMFDPRVTDADTAAKPAIKELTEIVERVGPK